MALSKKTYWFIFIAAIIIIGGAIALYFVFKGPKSEMCPDGKTPIPQNGICPKSSTMNPVQHASGCIQPSSYIDNQFPITLGMKDDTIIQRVSMLQHNLNLKYKAGLKEDGFFGCNTDDAAKKYLGTDVIYTTNAIWI